MQNIDFSFIKESVLRRNVEKISSDVLKLELLLNDASKEVVDCLRKTVVIYTASIIEALVFWKIREEITTERVILKDEWKYKDVKVLYAISNDSEIIGAERNREERSIDKLDFHTMIRISKDKRIFSNVLLKDLDQVRQLRNEIHIDRLEDIVKTYPMVNVDFVQETLVKTIHAVR